MSYRDFFSSAIQEDLAWSIASREVELPSDIVPQGPDFHSFPPSLIPLWRNGINLVGYWKHWFGLDRQIVMVDVDPELGYSARVMARSFSQLLMTFITDVIDMEEEITSEVEAFVEEYELDDIEMIDRTLELRIGDAELPSVLSKINGDPPNHLEIDYRRDFFQPEKAKSFD